VVLYHKIQQILCSLLPSVSIILSILVFCSFYLTMLVIIFLKFLSVNIFQNQADLSESKMI